MPSHNHTGGDGKRTSHSANAPTISTTCDCRPKQIPSALREWTGEGRWLVSQTARGQLDQHYPELGTAPVSYEDSISPEFYEIERKAVFKRAWLNVGRVEQLPRKGSYFTKELKVANTSIIVVRTTSGEVKAYHNICRHRGNKLVWNDMPLEETSGVCRQFTCKYHAWRYDLDGNLTFVQQEEEFFDLDKSRYGLVPRALRRLGGVHLRQPRRRTRTVAARLPRPDDHLASRAIRSAR